LPESFDESRDFRARLENRNRQPLPDFALKTLNGAASTMKKQMKARSQTLINVWATWCMPCAKEMPELEKMRPRLAARGIDLVGLNVDTEKTSTSKVTSRKKRVTYPILSAACRRSNSFTRPTN
jgi:peroxiredoxin